MIDLYEDHYDQSIIIYGVDEGDVYGGSDQQKTVKEVKTGPDGYYPGGDFTMELDLSNRNFVMEINGEKIILDANIGDFQYSPFVILAYNDAQITLL